MIQILKSTFHLFSYVSSPGFTKKINCPYTRPSCDFRDVSYNGYVDSKLVHSFGKCQCFLSVPSEDTRKIEITLCF